MLTLMLLGLLQTRTPIPESARLTTEVVRARCVETTEPHPTCFKSLFEITGPRDVSSGLRGQKIEISYRSYRPGDGGGVLHAVTGRELLIALVHPGDEMFLLVQHAGGRGTSAVIDPDLARLSFLPNLSDLVRPFSPTAPGSASVREVEEFAEIVSTGLRAVDARDRAELVRRLQGHRLQSARYYARWLQERQASRTTTSN